MAHKKISLQPPFPNSTTALRCCGVFRDSRAGHKTADLLTYFSCITVHYIIHIITYIGWY